MSKTRCFVAVELPDVVRVRLDQARIALVAQAPEWGAEKWVALHNVHLTLKFLGSLGEDDMLRMRRSLAEELAGVLAFSVDVTGLDAVPRTARCSMLWARLGDPTARCANLASRVEAAAVACGLPREDRPFAPHVTLARARKPRPLATDALTSADAVLRHPPLSMSVLSATLFASTLTRTGPVYETVESWAFRDETVGAPE
ncbi:MAG: RNA 2',3'-cyclic phosphodiesterase [Coriobacteriia bacterium]|nr:RNA 2',3'-cyclic phosphodiesterase [Coriobacteriia bacterium]